MQLNLNGDSWYDFGLVQFTGSVYVEKEDDDKFENNPDLQFDHHQETSDTPPNTHVHDMKNDTVYAIVHAAQKCLPIDNLQKNMVQYFTLIDLKSHVYILDIECIFSPLFAISDAGEIEEKRIGTFAGHKKTIGQNTWTSLLLMR